MVERFEIACYTRISVDDELDRDNVSIENQKAIIKDYAATHFPDSALTFFEDRDRSGYTFEQREGYQKMRKGLITHRFDILLIKDFSRFSRRNSRGLVELEDLRDAGVRIISIGDGIDFPNDDDWLKIQFQFLINEMPVTDTSKKVRNVIKRRQRDGQWLCAAPYGYVLTKNKTYQIVPEEAEVVRLIFKLYNVSGWGYKKIANYLTDRSIPTPRMSEKMRKEAMGEACKRSIKATWSIITIQEILDNDFYIGTLRQGKYKRTKINGKYVKVDARDQIVIENQHAPVIDAQTFATTCSLREKRTRNNYRGIRINDNVYSGFLVCGDCGSPMFAMSRRDLAPAYTCGLYHVRGLKGCTSHYIRAEKLDEIVKLYVRKVMNASSSMLERLDADLLKKQKEDSELEQSADSLPRVLEDLREELRTTKRQRIRDIMKHPEQEDELERTYEGLEDELQKKINGLTNQLRLLSDKRNAILSVNRTAKAATEVFQEILGKETLDRNDLNLIIDQILVFEDHVEIKLQADIDSVIHSKLMEDTVNFKSDTENIESCVVQSAKNHADKVFGVNVISEGDPLEIYTDKDGEVILKKYSPIGEISNFARDYTESLFRSLGHIACITDKDMIVSASGVSRKELWEKPISRDLEQAIQSRQVVTANRGSGSRLVPVTNEEDAQAYTAQVICPIIADGESIGAVVLLSREPAAQMGDTELKVAETTASIVGRQMEQ